MSSLDPSLSSVEAELAAAKAEFVSLSEEFEALRAEYQLINEELTARNDDLHRLREEMAAAEAKSRAALAALEAELQRERAAREAAERAAAEIPVRKEDADAPASRRLDASAIESAVSDLAGFSGDLSASFPGSSAGRGAGDDEQTSFHLDRTLSSVRFGAGDEIIELHASLNAAQINPPGGKAQSCLAWVCGIERYGSPEIYVAFYLTESRETLVHVPERQPSGLAAYSRAIRSAVTFAETVGFMMEPLPLGPSAERAQLIADIPIFGR